MDIFSYVITSDSGFAPNPFGGFLTLATCKPQIRRAAQEGDLILATGSVSTRYRRKLVYAAVVSQVVSLEDYGRSAMYKIKRPAIKGKWWRKHGDSIYTKVDGRWKRRCSEYHTSREDMARDLRGKQVLVCKQFWYFGASAITIPTALQKVIHKGRAHTRIEDSTLAQRVVEWLEGNYQRGRRGTPDLSPKPTSRCQRGTGC